MNLETSIFCSHAGNYGIHHSSICSITFLHCSFMICKPIASYQSLIMDRHFTVRADSIIVRLGGSSYSSTESWKGYSLPLLQLNSVIWQRRCSDPPYFTCDNFLFTTDLHYQSKCFPEYCKAETRTFPIYTSHGRHPPIPRYHYQHFC